jgi:hypothetical protein
MFISLLEAACSNIGGHRAGCQMALSGALCGYGLAVGLSQINSAASSRARRPALQGNLSGWDRSTAGFGS